MSTSKNTRVRRGHLILLRGGLDAHSAAEQADWDSFCERIGWQQPSAPLEDDFEKRLAERIFGDDGSAKVIPLDAMRMDATRSSFASNAEPLTLQQEKAQSRRRALTMPGFAVTFAAAVAVLMAVVASRAARPELPAATAEPRATAAAAVVTRSETTAAPAPSIRPQDAAPAPSTQPDTPPAEPAPTEHVARPRWKRPGAYVARNGAARPARKEASRQESQTKPRAQAPVETLALGRSSEDAAPSRPGEDFSETLFVAMHDIERPKAPAMSFLEARRPLEMAAPIQLVRSESPSPALSRAEGWSLSESSGRWYGASLPPAHDTNELPSGMGVIAQVDLAKAFDGL